MMKKSCPNGQIYRCNACKKLHLEYGNLGLDFPSPEKLVEFKSYLKTVHANHFEHEVKSNNQRRKLLIPFANMPVKLLLSDAEIMELIDLLNDFMDLLSRSEYTGSNFKNSQLAWDLSKFTLN
ncbi:DUF6686 family protein [Sunxiuqinia elliptica]|uniref:Uncharacterized protein n=1 Tax=Sunxiuqinia elliptica TaxID=655355 RepID=A0A4V3BWT6_9BACT|nr:DUF6686 family protein [Sunxiuqinia elliptica]TDN96278.1 hypothetical protein DET52_112105 [Sunxiuqinia elliptica]TDO67989.1 hypothetical protein DET65_0105 [Sunxiuqinia elliptica]